MELGKMLYVVNWEAWRAWLSKHHAKEKEIWLVYYRKSSGKPRIPYNDAVEEALCFGWIDSIVKRVDDGRFAQRFSPRRPTSQLSQMNKERIGALIAKKRMTRAGMAAVAHAYNGESDHGKARVSKEIMDAIRKNPAAYKHFLKLPESYKRIRIAYIEGRRRRGSEAFRKSLANFIGITARGRRFGMVRE
jgi:uncharacterized protein YdeI (YjbR/CyaY-like superfamily)